MEGGFVFSVCDKKDCAKFGFDCVIINAIFIMIYKYINAQTTDVHEITI